MLAVKICLYPKKLTRTSRLSIRCFVNISLHMRGLNKITKFLENPLIKKKRRKLEKRNIEKCSNISESSLFFLRNKIIVIHVRVMRVLRYIVNTIKYNRNKYWRQFLFTTLSISYCILSIIYNMCTYIQVIRHFKHKWTRVTTRIIHMGKKRF